MLYKGALAPSQWTEIQISREKKKLIGIFCTKMDFFFLEAGIFGTAINVIYFTGRDFRAVWSKCP